MNRILARLLNPTLPSYTGRVVYTVTDVQAGTSVTLESPNRKLPSVLPWKDIQRVFASAGTSLTPSKVDVILSNPQNRDSSTMCALVLAMRTMQTGRMRRPANGRANMPLKLSGGRGRPPAA